MARRREQSIEHLLRRAGFGASQAEVDQVADIGFRGAVNRLNDFDDEEDDVDDRIGKPGLVGITARTAFLPAENITDARQRWRPPMRRAVPPARIAAAGREPWVTNSDDIRTVADE
jgi:hypothetical protein